MRRHGAKRGKPLSELVAPLAGRYVQSEEINIEIKEEDLRNTTYVFTLEDGTEVMGSPNPGYWGKLTVIIGRDITGAALPFLIVLFLVAVLSKLIGAGPQSTSTPARSRISPMIASETSTSVRCSVLRTRRTRARSGGSRIP